MATSSASSLGPITTPELNRTFYAGTQQYPTIQSAVTAAASMAGGATVMREFGAVTNDTPAQAVGTAAVSIIDGNALLPIYYTWQNGFYVVSPPTFTSLAVGAGGITTTGTVSALQGLFTAETHISNGVYADPAVGVNYDLKLGGPGNGIAVAGPSLFNGQVAIGSSAKPASLALNGGTALTALGTAAAQNVSAFDAAGAAAAAAAASLPLTGGRLTGALTGIAATFTAETHVSNGAFTDPGAGASYDLKLGGPGNGIAVAGASLFNGNVTTGSITVHGNVNTTGSGTITSSAFFGGTLTASNAGCQTLQVAQGGSLSGTFSGDPTFSGNPIFSAGSIVSINGGAFIAGANFSDSVSFTNTAPVDFGTTVTFDTNSSIIFRSGASIAGIPNFVGNPTFSGNPAFSGNPVFSGVPSFTHTGSAINFACPITTAGLQGTTYIDSLAANTGATTFPVGTPPPMILFGGVGSSGEGISSPRTSGSAIPQYSVVIWTGLAPRLTVAPGGNVGIGTTTPSTALQVNGTITATTKNFAIPYPGDATKLLVHSCIEGPEIGLYYRGQAELSGGLATVALPPYFEQLAMKVGRTVLLTPVFVNNTDAVSNLAASVVAGGQFNVRGIDASNPSQQFCWEVKAVRADVAPLVVAQPVTLPN